MNNFWHRIKLSLGTIVIAALFGFLIVSQASTDSELILDTKVAPSGDTSKLTVDLPDSTKSAASYRANHLPIPLLSPPVGNLDVTDVSNVLAQALTRATQLSTNATAAVVDREGFVLGVWSLQGSNAPALDVLDAITKAGTAGFLSSDNHAFSTRTAGFIVQQNFPPGIRNKANGPLVGVNFSGLSFSDVNRFKNPHTYSPLAYGGSGTNGAPLSGPAAISGLAGSPGGLPLYKNDRLVGGIGVVVTGRPPIPALADIQLRAAQKYDVDEDAALAGQSGFAPDKSILGSRVFIAGIRLPYIKSKLRHGAVFSLTSLGGVVSPYELTNSPPVSYPVVTNFGGLAGVVGEIRSPIMADPLPGTIGGQVRLAAEEVTNILALAAQRANITRAGIRLPAGRSARAFITVINNPDADGVSPTVLGTFRTPDATIFSWDVSAQKARTALYFSRSNSLFVTGTAVSTRAVGFLAEAMYPPGIAGTSPGPWLGLQEQFSLLPAGVTNPLNGVSFSTNQVLEPSLPNGITIFPGGFPLYRNGVLIGAIGVSGDGVDQDDLIAAAGTVNFLAPEAIRTDKLIYRGTRLPYAKFPRNPSR